MTVYFTTLAGSSSAVTSAGTVWLYHGTTEESAVSIVTGGVSCIIANQISGFEDFWATIDPQNAAFYAGIATPTSKKRAVVKFGLPVVKLDGFLTASPATAAWYPMDQAVQFTKHCHTELNASMTNVEIVRELNL